ncbi:unnamed protein product [Ectocarpus sp. 6 AP-2014]
MRSTGVALAFLAVRSRLTWLGPRQGICGALRATDTTQRHILVLDPASPAHQGIETAGYQVTAAHGLSDTELEKVLPAYDAVVVRSANQITRNMLVTSPRVAIVGRAGSGVDNIDLKAASELGVPVVNAPTGNSGSVAELVMGLMLGVSRSISSARDTTRRGEWAKSNFTGRTLSGKTLGIVGFGSVGIALARLAVAFGMVVLIAEGSSPTPCSGRAEEINPRAYEREATASQAGVTLPPLPLDELLSKSDFLSVHCPLTADTKGLISRRELALMKPSAVVINAARGGVVDELALLQSLEQGHLGGAALDVFECERSPLEDHVVSLCRLPNVLCTPHIGGSTEEAGERVLTEVCGAVVDFFQGTLPASKIVNGAPDTTVRLSRLGSSS